MKSITDETLARLDAETFGSGAEPSMQGGDDRAGKYWRVTDPQVNVAAKVALITGRPLLLEGESGVGKSSLARALAETLGWDYYETVVTSRTELASLSGDVDHVRRLYEAEKTARLEGAEFDENLERFLVPGVLWWAFNPRTASAVADSPDPKTAPRKPNHAEAGAVVLVDELDKADPDLPNNLLVPFGSMQLNIEARSEPVEAVRQVLLCVTSNRERDMPPAFLRRCVSLQLQYPSRDELIDIARHHVAGAVVPGIADVIADRFLEGDRPHMSAAEFVDAVRAAVGLGLDSSGEGPEWEALVELFESTRRRRAN